MKRVPVRGTTLIELMVALVIGMILSLAVFSVMSIFEGRRRTLDAGSDLDQSASVAMFWRLRAAHPQSRRASH